jgi:hypothetical protein
MVSYRRNKGRRHACDRDPTAESSTGGDSQSVVPSGTEKTQ